MIFIASLKKRNHFRYPDKSVKLFTEIQLKRLFDWLSNKLIISNKLTFITYILGFTHSFLHKKTRLKILIANHSSEMAFSHVRKAFRRIRRDLSKHTTDFIQQVQVLCVQTSITRNFVYQKYKNTCTFNNG